MKNQFIQHSLFKWSILQIFSLKLNRTNIDRMVTNHNFLIMHCLCLNRLNLLHSIEWCLFSHSPRNSSFNIFDIVIKILVKSNRLIINSSIFWGSLQSQFVNNSYIQRINFYWLKWLDFYHILPKIIPNIMIWFSVQKLYPNLRNGWLTKTILSILKKNVCILLEI